MLTDILVGLLTAMLLGMTVHEAQAEPLDPTRVQQIAAMLSDQPVGLGAPISDRAAWQGKPLPQAAERYLTEPLPDQPDELFLDFSRTGNRSRWERVSGQRRGRLAPLVVAECVENRGRFLPAIETLLRALCAEKTWVLPAHDSRLINFKGEGITIDLASSALAWNLATADWLVGEKLSPDVRQLLRDSIHRFVLKPYRDMITEARPKDWWMLTNSNWNAVCLAGVTGAALPLVPSKQERAEVIAAAELYSRNFLSGFTPDGYCSEGLGYWNYGFGHYVLLTETVRQATGDKLDLLARPEAKAPALFPTRIMADDQVGPAFADCHVNSRPAANYMFYLNRVFQLGYKRWDTLSTPSSGSLAEWMIFAFPNSASQMPAATGAEPARELRSWFADAGVLVARPAGDPTGKLAVALKGGHNAELHNHNDVGSYTVFLNGRMPLLDPGSEVYTQRTFSSRRYESKLLNSFGHPVPVVAGNLQRPGADAKAEILATGFTPEQDTVRMSLKAAYPVPELQTLERTFVFSRQGSGSLTVTDRVAYTTPQSFETALIAYNDWQRLPDGRLMAWHADQAVAIEVKAEGGEIEIVPERIEEDGAVHPMRLGLRFKQPVTTATITMTIMPLPVEDKTGNLLRNGDFETSSFGWELPPGGQGTLSTEQAASGNASLKISDPDTKVGSNVTSAPIPVPPGQDSYVLSGKVFHVSGGGIGMYMRFFDAAGNSLNKADEKGNIAPVGSLLGAVGQWADFRYPFKVEPGTTTMRLWIHSYSSAVVEAYLDDLRVEAVAP